MTTAIILAGGLGTRLRPKVANLPKPMAPICNRPFLEYLMDYWMKEGVKHFHLSTGYMFQKIQAYFGDSYRGVKVSYSVENNPLGTGGGLKLSLIDLDYLDNFLLLNGDTFFKVPLKQLINSFNKNNTTLTMCLFNFEHDYYRNKNLPSIHIGHPFSKLFKHDSKHVYKKYHLDASKKYISILPGSRVSEIENLLPTYIEFINIHANKNEDYVYLIPASDQKIFETIDNLVPKSLPVKLSIDSAKDFLSISDCSVVTSGTATLEAAILGASPIICYKTNPINYFIISRMLKIDDVGLPNLLLGSRKFPELIQKKCTPQEILKAIEYNDFHHLNSLSEQLRTLLIGSEETEHTNAILKL